MSRSEDEERVKSPISGAKGVHWRSDRHERSGRRDYQREIGKIFGSFFTKAGLDVRKLDEILVQERDEVRRNFHEEVANAAKHFSSAQAIFRQDIETRRTALAILAKPFLSTRVTLDEPSVIFEYPQWSPAIVDTHYEPFNNWVKIRIFDHGPVKDRRWFGFSYPWTNETDYYAIINITTFLVLVGNCESHGEGGVFSADNALLDLSSRFDLFRQSGWGSDPFFGDGTWLVQNNLQPIANLDSYGGKWIYGGGDVTKTQVFDFAQSVLGQGFVLVPGRAQIVVFVALQIGWEIDGNNLSNVVSANFADDNLFVSCPFVSLELLTAPPMA
jgi:hypothetical protein